MRRALLIGINEYDCSSNLSGCVRDATSLRSVLNVHGDGSPNFDVRLLTSDDDQINTSDMALAIEQLFAAEADVALLYFAGHGALHSNGAGYLMSQDGKDGALGVALADIIGYANNAHRKIKSTIIILDSCHAGAAAESPGLLADEASVLGKGVIVLSAAHKDGYAEERGGRGVFTDLLIEGLNGSASDILGNITPAAVYSLVDQTLGSWEQRPIFKANVQNFVSLRKVAPKISPDILRCLPVYFPEESYIYCLDPSHEPDRNNIPEEFRHLPINDEKVLIFKNLQRFNRFGLVAPIDVEHMYDAAIKSTGCRLTALGAHYRMLAEKGRF